jgi:hypothetical protein
MLIGLDFDNTIVCYDQAIARLADEMFDLPKELPRTKIAVRNFLRNANRELDWTTLQGSLYGPGMAYAEPFEQVAAAINELKDAGYSMCIVSHRSRQPYAGPAYNLHRAAKEWIEKHLTKFGLIPNDQAFFNETLKEKLAKIESLGCKFFLDDLPEVLGDPSFPKFCKPILFDPKASHVGLTLPRISSWEQLPNMISAQK